MAGNGPPRGHGPAATHGTMADNLRFLASQERSVSDLCRKLGINRQQFNKYLAGKVKPSPAILRRIADHFVLEDDELFLEPERFRQLFKNKLKLAPGSASRFFDEWQSLQSTSDARLVEYTGLYIRYFPSFSRRGQILKSMLKIEIQDGIGTFRCIERIQPDFARRKRATLFKYQGIALFLRERIFLIGRETLGKNELTQTVLVPTYANGIPYLFGIISGCSAAAMREPMSARIAFEKLDEPVSIRTTLGQLGAFAPDSPEIPKEISAYLGAPADDLSVLRGIPNI